MAGVQKRQWRTNGVVGRVVPLLLLIFLILAYRLVIFDYDTGHLCHREGKCKTAAVHGLISHILLSVPLWAYLRVFFSRLAKSTQKGPVTHSFFFGGAVNPVPPVEPPEILVKKLIIFECDSKGDPLRCYRDDCNGRWKPARSRHCGDCRQCRVALDHHCPWFDADITVPHTLMPFLLFLAFIPLLLIFAFGPFFLLSYRHSHFIWQYASQSQQVHDVWWSRKRSWVGGPMYRWLIGFWLGSRRCCSSSEDLFASPNLYLPTMTLLAFALILIASALLLSTLQQIVVGDLTIDARIRKLLGREMSEKEKQRWQRYFWVPLPGNPGFGEVVAIAANERPYDLGSLRDNMRAFMCRPPYTLEQLQMQWPISESMQSQLIARAEAQARKAV